MNPLTWQNPEQLFVAQVLKKIFYNSVAELRLTKNASLNYLEKENRHPTLSSEQLPELSGQADSPEDTLISEELFARYVKALDRLPERCREVFIRLREEKQSYAQVAEELNISTKTVDAQLQKALTRLKEALLTE